MKGQWMNVDLSPDGKDIVFDLLGDIYIMPVSGGTAKVLRQGKAMEVQPRFSPDGKKYLLLRMQVVVIISGPWTRDGSNTKQLTKESFRLLNNAVWTPDGSML